MSGRRDKKPYIVHTIGEVARFFDYAESYINQWWPKGCPREKNGKSNRYKYDLRAIMLWARDNIWQKPALRPGPGDDPDLFGEFDSPALERYRTARAEEVEIKLLELKRKIVPREVAHECTMRLASIMRGMGETLQKNYGPDAQEILNEALDDYEKVVDDFYADEQLD